MTKGFVILLVPFLFACTKKETPSAPALAPAVKAETPTAPGDLPAGSMGAVYLGETPATDSYRLKIVFPNDQVDGTNSPQNQDDTPYTARNYAVKLGGALALYDQKGLLGRIKTPDTLLGVFWCENDGGTKYRPEVTIDVPKSDLKRPLAPADETSKIVALALVDETHQLAPLKFGAPADSKIRHRHEYKFGADATIGARVLVWNDAGVADYGPYVGLAMRGTYLPLTCDGP